MNQHIAQVSLVVKDYDEAINFYTQKLYFLLLEDTKMDEKKDGLSLLLREQKNVVSCWQKLPMKNKSQVLAIRPVAGCFCFFTRTTFGEITTKW